MEQKVRDRLQTSGYDMEEASAVLRESPTHGALLMLKTSVETLSLIVIDLAKAVDDLAAGRPVE